MFASFFNPYNFGAVFKQYTAHTMCIYDAATTSQCTVGYSNADGTLSIESGEKIATKNPASTIQETL